MNFIIYWVAKSIVFIIQALPLPLVARLGRGFGAFAYLVDAKHRRIVLENLTACSSREKFAAEIQAIARENFRRIGENYLSAIKTASMTCPALRPHLEFTGLENFPTAPAGTKPQNAVVGIGHFGNFELYARLHEVMPAFAVSTTYRALKQPALDRILQELRTHSPCQFFERRRDGAALKKLLDEGGVILGLLADQSSRGVRAPFLGRDCNTGLATAILALRYDARFLTGVCYRVALAKWRIEFYQPIPTHVNGKMRSSEDLTLEMNRQLETAVRRDPANWFWVHRRWKD